MNGNHNVSNKPIFLLIDGECLLCHAITRFVVKRDRAGRFRFAALQSPAGQWFLERGGLPRDDFDTFVMVEDGRYYTRSEAALRTLRQLGGVWGWMFLFIAVPAFLRDWVYKQVATRRYRWFGKYDTCVLPTKEQRSRFVVEREEVAGK